MQQNLSNVNILIYDVETVSQRYLTISCQNRHEHCQTEIILDDSSDSHPTLYLWTNRWLIFIQLRNINSYIYNQPKSGANCNFHVIDNEQNVIGDQMSTTMRFMYFNSNNCHSYCISIDYNIRIQL
jgi:hypothetical protein